MLFRQRSGGSTGPPVPSGPVERGQVRLEPATLGEGWHDAYLRIETATGVLDERLRLGSVTIAQHPPYAVAGRDGALSIRRLGPEEAVPADLVNRPAGRGRGFGAPSLEGLVGRLTAVLPDAARPLARRVRRRLASRR